MAAMFSRSELTSIYRGLLRYQKDLSPDDPQVAKILDCLDSMRICGIMFQMVIAGELVPLRFDALGELEFDYIEQAPSQYRKLAPLPLGACVELTLDETEIVTRGFQSRQASRSQEDIDADLARVLEIMVEWKTDMIRTDMLFDNLIEVCRLDGAGHVQFAEIEPLAARTDFTTMHRRSQQSRRGRWR